MIPLSYSADPTSPSLSCSLRFFVLRARLEMQAKTKAPKAAAGHTYTVDFTGPANDKIVSLAGFSARGIERRRGLKRAER